MPHTIPPYRKIIINEIAIAPILLLIIPPKNRNDANAYITPLTPIWYAGRANIHTKNPVITYNVAKIIT
jgi:hypothetical protein